MVSETLATGSLAANDFEDSKSTIKSRMPPPKAAVRFCQLGDAPSFVLGSQACDEINE